MSATTITAADLCTALWSGRFGWHRIPTYRDDDPIRVVNLGVYPGTEIRLLPVPKNVELHLDLSKPSIVIEDSEGGWIAERFGPLSMRESAAVRAFLAQRS